MFRWLFGRGGRQAPSGGKSLQVAALPWRRTTSGLEILLITSRETRRWVIPKGWPMKNRTHAEAAAREALEEAGVSGRIGQAPIGSFAYAKRRKNGSTRPVQVEVFALEVERQAREWREKGQRTLAWVEPAEAARRVDEPDLKALILNFSPGAVP